MTHKKRSSTRKMEDYKKEKMEFGEELGFHGANNTEVNAKMASRGESKYSNKTMGSKHEIGKNEKAQQTRY